MADVIPFKKPDPKGRVCSFCKTPESKAKKFVTNGRDKAICDKCIEACQQRLKETQSESK